MIGNGRGVEVVLEGSVFGGCIQRATTGTASNNAKRCFGVESCNKVIRRVYAPGRIGATQACWPSGRAGDIPSRAQDVQPRVRPTSLEAPPRQRCTGLAAGEEETRLPKKV